MTAIDRFDPFEQRITAAIDEIAAPRRPDYLDDILRQTARTSQRPRWTFPGTWLPIDATLPARSGPLGRLSARPALLLVLLLLLLAAAAVLVVGSRNRVPEPFGLTDNGQLAYAGTFEPVLPGVDGMLGYPPTVTGLGDGRVLALADGQLQVFDPATDRLTTTGRTVAQRTTGAVLVPLSDGLVLITGGDSAAFPDETGGAALGSATAEILDPATGHSSPVGGVAAPWGFAAARLMDGSVLVTGGSVPVAAGAESPALAVASVFDPEMRRFTDVGNMSIPRAGHHIVPLLDGGALVVGGAQDAAAERFDQRTGTFAITGAMADPGVAAAVRLLDGRVLVIHGWCGELQRMDKDGFGTGYRSVQTEIFDPAAGRFVRAADLPHCVSSATLLPNGEVLVEGFWGEGRNTRQSANVVAPGTAWSGRFDPVTGRIVETAGPDRYRATPALLPDGSVLFVGGNAFSDALPSWATRYR